MTLAGGLWSIQLWWWGLQAKSETSCDLLLGVFCGPFWRNCGRDDHWLRLLQRLQHKATERPTFLALYSGLCSLCALCCTLQYLPLTSIIRPYIYTQPPILKVNTKSLNVTLRKLNFTDVFQSKVAFQRLCECSAQFLCYIRFSFFLKVLYLWV